MLRARATSLFLSAMATSVVTHAGMLLLVGISLHRAAQQRMLTRAESVPKLMPVELTLGLESPHPDATAWLGLDEATPQMAEPAVIDQAAFDPDANTSELAPDPDPQPAPSPQPSVESESLPEAQPAETVTEPANPKAFDELLEELIKNMKQAARPETSDTSELRDPVEAPDAAKTKKAEAPTSQPVQTHREQSTPAQDSTLHRAAVPADKESQPTSVIDVTPDQWQFGKPLAAQGLEIKTRRPVFTVLTLMTAAPGNPLCEIKFDRSGVAKSASIVRGSGDQRVDDAILACLYRWRAEGSKLQALKGNDTIPVRIRMILRRTSRDEDEADSAG
jgi:hypothetical protein